MRVQSELSEKERVSQLNTQSYDWDRECDWQCSSLVGSVQWEAVRAAKKPSWAKDIANVLKRKMLRKRRLAKRLRMPRYSEACLIPLRLTRWSGKQIERQSPLGPS